ncbi:MAG: hypothetical protein PVG14_03095 [Anaerolineales bacterium]|jgi:hypothetical protein
MKKRLGIILAGFIIAALSFTIVLSKTQEKSSTNFAIPWDVVSGGGNEISSTNYTIKGTTGQATIGIGSSSSYTIGAGYWYGVDEGLFQILLPLIIKNHSP